MRGRRDRPRVVAVVRHRPRARRHARAGADRGWRLLPLDAARGRLPRSCAAPAAVAPAFRLSQQLQLRVVSSSNVVILSAARTPIGRYGGTLRDVHPAELGAVAARAAVARAELQPSDVEAIW